MPVTTSGNHKRRYLVFGVHGTAVHGTFGCSPFGIGQDADMVDGRRSGQFDDMGSSSRTALTPCKLTHQYSHILLPFQSQRRLYLVTVGQTHVKG